MKLSKSKLALAKVINGSGGWPSDEANFAAQDKIDGESNDNTVSFYSGKVKPTRRADCSMWRCEDAGSHFMGYEKTIKRCKLLPNWHQTCLSREEYYQAYPEADADGWIEWNGLNISPVKNGVEVDIKFPDGEVATVFNPAFMRWSHHESPSDIIAYLLHKPEVKPEFCESVMRSIPEPDEQVWTNPPTIEQLASDYRSTKDYAYRKQQEADAAKDGADAKLAELVAAGKALGLVLSVAEPELVTTKFTGKFHSAKYGDRPSDLDMICDGCGKRFGHHVGFDCRP